MMTHPWDSNTACGRRLGVICYRDGVMNLQRHGYSKRKSEMVAKQQLSTKE
jgi:hypothetical protein